MEKLLEVSRSPEGELVIRIAAPKRVPSQVRRHLRQATKEGILALRSLLDEALSRVEEAEKKTEKKGPRKIDVQ